MAGKFVDNTQQYFAFTPQANFPAIIRIFSEGDEIQSRLPFKIISTSNWQLFVFWWTWKQATCTTTFFHNSSSKTMNQTYFSKKCHCVSVNQNQSQQNQNRTSETGLAIALMGIVVMHIVCHSLRVFLAGLAVYFIKDTLVCMTEGVGYAPPLWTMCAESISSLLIMINFSGIYLSWQIFNICFFRFFYSIYLVDL